MQKIPLRPSDAARPRDPRPPTFINQPGGRSLQGSAGASGEKPGTPQSCSPFPPAPFLQPPPPLPSSFPTVRQQDYDANTPPHHSLSPRTRITAMRLPGQRRLSHAVEDCRRSERRSPPVPCRPRVQRKATQLSAASQPQQKGTGRTAVSSRAAKRAPDKAYYDRKLPSSAIQAAVRGDINQWRANYDTTLSRVSAAN